MIREINIVHSDISKAELAHMPTAVTSRGALLKNREGGIAPALDLGCTLIRLRVVACDVHMWFPEGEYCNMGAATRLAASLASDIVRVRTWSGDREDVRYLMREYGWVCEVSDASGE